MARTVRRTTQFKRDYKLMKRRGKEMEKLRVEPGVVIFERTGTHSDLFR